MGPKTVRSTVLTAEEEAAIRRLPQAYASHEEIAARFFVSATFVQQRLRLAKVSRKLHEVYEQEGMQLEQLMAFTVTDDHARQEEVWEALENSWSKEPQQIRRLLSQLKVFREVLRAGSTRRAALALGISQPAVSQHVKQLETTLGITRFKRSANRLPEVAGDKPAKQPFKRCPIGYFHIDIAEVRTEEGKLYLFVAVDRTSKFVFARLMQKATTVAARAFLDELVDAVPYKIHTVLTDNGIQFADLPKHRDAPTARWRAPRPRAPGGMGVMAGAEQACA